jgi:cytochrome b561
MLFLLLTICLRLGWMEKGHMASIMNTYLVDAGVQLTDQQLLTMAKQVRKPMWTWHIYAGYLLLGLYALRLLVPFFGEMRITNPMQPGLSGKERLQFWTYVVFYVCVAISLVTGLLIVWGPESAEEVAEGIHVLSLYYLVPFILLHLGGILLAEFGDQKGIVSRVISGGK